MEREIEGKKERMTVRATERVKTRRGKVKKERSKMDNKMAERSSR